MIEVKAKVRKWGRSLGVVIPKGKIMKELNKGNTEIKDLAKITDKTEAMVYAHLSDLKAEGYVAEDLKLTVSGRIAIL